MSTAKKELGACQVRCKTNNPCARPAVVEIWGILFCERCACEQEACFVIGELTEGPQYLRDELLVEALNRMR